jgi:drug/metabolite transporter (DMT)-like permease
VFSISYLGASRYNKRLGSRRFTATAMTAACIGTLCHGFIAEGVSVLAAPPEVWAWAALLGIGATVMATLCMNEGMRRLGAERGAVLSTVSPVMTIVLAWLALGEEPGLTQAIGMTITIVGATALALNKPSPPRPTMQTKAAPG